MNFRVRVDNVADQERAVEFGFATQSDLVLLKKWNCTAKQRDNPHVQDALEYCTHVEKRWKSYSALSRLITDQRDFPTSGKQRENAELVFLMVARADWHKPSPILGFCFCRRTYCHHIVLDFAAAHPNAIKKAGGEVHGVGFGMLYSLTRFAADSGVDMLWGEATLNSHGFYEAALGARIITDYFFISHNVFDHCLQQHKSFLI
jgi:hypothetical protein